MRLNGWQRLWVVIFGVWTVTVTLVAYMLWPPLIGVTTVSGEVTAPNGQTFEISGPEAPSASALVKIFSVGSGSANSGSESLSGADYQYLAGMLRSDDPNVRAQGQMLAKKLTADEQRAFAPYEQPLSMDPNWGLPPGFTLYPPTSTVVAKTSSEPRPTTVVMTDGIEHVFPPKFDLARAEATAKRQANSTRRRSFVLTALTAWIIPPMAIYILGWSFAWVRRGFATTNPLPW